MRCVTLNMLSQHESNQQKDPFNQQMTKIDITTLTTIQNMHSLTDQNDKQNKTTLAIGTSKTDLCTAG